MSRTIQSLLVATALAAVCVPLSNAAQAGKSTFARSCKNVAIAGSTLTANCRRVNGSYTETSIDLPGIENIDGNLRYTDRSNASSYADSCEDIKIVGATITASCKKMDGEMNGTSIVIQDIENIDGNLQSR